MKPLYEQAKDLAKDARAIFEQMYENGSYDERKVVGMIGTLMYKYSALRIEIIESGKNENS